MLKKYWFILNPEYRFGPQNIGVTASSATEGKILIIEALERLDAHDVIEKFNAEIEVVEDIDIGLLDQNHVIPNMGPVIFRGVWFPRLNI